MSGMEVSLQNNNTAVVAGRQEESEYNEETVLTEVNKDLGHTKMHEKKAEFQSQENTSVVEQNKSMKSQENKQITESQSETVTATSKVMKKEFSSSESFSSEEYEEYEIEG